MPSPLNLLHRIHLTVFAIAISAITISNAAPTAAKFLAARDGPEIDNIRQAVQKEFLPTIIEIHIVFGFVALSILLGIIQLLYMCCTA